METLKAFLNMPLEELRAKARRGEFGPQPGQWTLTRPDGKQFTGKDAFACIRAEADDRIPADVGLQWTLTRPDGKQFTGKDAFACLRAEADDRIPADVGLARIALGIRDDNDTECGP